LKRHLARHLIGLAATLFFVWHAAQPEKFDLVDRLDSIIYDARLRLAMPGKGDPRIVILDIDEKSLAELGRWPWSRNVIARLVDKLFDQYGVSVLAFDVLWPERDSSSGMDVLDKLAQGELQNAGAFQSAYRRLRGGLDYDGMLAASMKGRPVVLGHYFIFEDTSIRANVIPRPVLPNGALAASGTTTLRSNGYTGYLPEYLSAAASAGFLNPKTDNDGVVRRVPMLVEYDGNYYESFSMAVARTWLATQIADRQQPTVLPRQESIIGYARLEALDIGPLTIPVDENAMALVPYAGPRFSFDYLSIADVLAGRVKPDQLKDRIAIVGTTTPGLLDLRSTPVGTVYPGVEAHASLVGGILGGKMKKTPGFTVGAEVVLLLATGIALSLCMAPLSALWATLIALAAMLMAIGFDVFVWAQLNTVLPLANAVLMIGVIYILNMAYGYFVEDRAKRHAIEQFGQYAPPEVVDHIVANPDKYSMEPKAAELTILFSDVRGFTGISEALKPDELREYINEYLTDMSGIIRGRYRGTLDKYIGDAIMAFWGAPVEDPQHARNGVLAALHMQKECEVLNAKFAGRGWPALKIGVGLNSGNVRVGDMGSQVRRAYTVMGDAVNVASRLEARTKYYGVGVLVGAATRNGVSDVLFREVDQVRLKGKDAAVTIFEPLGLESEAGPQIREDMRAWEAVLAAYRSRDWDAAEARLDELRRHDANHGLYALYAQRISDFRRMPPPPDWAGVTVFDEK
jgi:adenylate cyclase